MYLDDLWDEPGKARIARAKDQALQARLKVIEDGIGDVKSENEALREIARTALGAIAEMVTAHGNLPPKTEGDLMKLLHRVVEKHDIKMDSTSRQNLGIMAKRAP